MYKNLHVIDLRMLSIYPVSWNQKCLNCEDLFSLFSSLLISMVFTVLAMSFISCLLHYKMQRPFFFNSVALWFPPKYQVPYIQLIHHMKYQKKQWVFHVCSTSHSTVIFTVDLIQQNQESTYLFRPNNLAQNQFKVFIKNEFIMSTDFLQVSSFVVDEFRLLPLRFMGNDWLTDFTSCNMYDIRSIF